MWKFLLLIFSVFIGGYVYAQEPVLRAEGSAPELYISHTVAAKENYYSIGRLYNVAPKELAPYNKLQFETGLTLAQVIKVPLTSANFTQTGELNDNELGVPVYHIVQPKEGLYRISVNYNKVSLDALRRWNKLSSDVVSNGNRLIIGYLKVLADQSPLAKKGVKIELLQPDPATAKIAEPQKSIPVTEDKKDPPITSSNKEIVADVNKVQGNNKPPAATGSSMDKPAIDFKGGAFKKSFSNGDSGVNESGSMGIFKSTSGWQDGKYYCLHNTARPETIIKVTNPANGRIVYAKVLDMMPDLKQNSGALILISNAAAEELGLNDTRSDVTLNYSQR